MDKCDEWDFSHPALDRLEMLPIQIRPSLRILIYGLPHDLTKEEADKIARVVQALGT